MSAIADRYHRLAEALTTTVDAVPDDAWSRQSPCEDWTALDVLAHVATTQWEHLDRVGLQPDDVDLPDDPRQAWSVVRQCFEELLNDPERAGTGYDSYFGKTTFEDSVDKFYSSDMVVHRWDLARAAGLTEHEAMPTGEAEHLLNFYASLGDNARQPTVFGPEVDVADDADPQTRLLGFVGRQP